MGVLGFDLRDALRGLRRDRGYAATVIFTLALTIGATTAVFSIVDGVLLKPLPFDESQRLVSLREVWREFENRYPTLDVNERHFTYWREHASSFESLAQYVRLPANLTGAGDAAQVTVVRASGSLFDVLGVSAALGRTMTPRDEPEGAPDVVTLTDTVWRQRFGSDPGVIGRAIVLDGRPYTVVGVLPADFTLPFSGQLSAAVDAFIPLRVSVGWVGDHNDEAIARLRTGVNIEAARAELEMLQAQVSDVATKEAHEPVTLGAAVVPLTEHVIGTSRRGLMLLLAAVVAVLLIACSNLANLSLTRSLARVRETAIRAALGAARGRLIGRAILEQLLLSFVGGALGIWVAWAALALFVRTAPLDLPRVNEVALDGRAIGFTAAVALLAGVLVAAVPAIRLASQDLQAVLRAGVAAASARGRLRSHAILLAAQIGLSVTLLVVTALFGASFMRVLNVNRGFTSANVLAVDVALPATRYAEEANRQAAYDRMLDGVRALPGVESVATTSMLPLRGQGQVNFVAPEGSTAPASELPTANYRFVAPDFFRTLGIAIERGRPFTEGERDPRRPAPALVSRPTAARLWPGQDPIGQRFSRGMATEQHFEVVGVVADARTTSLDRSQPLMVYVPYWWRSRPSVSLLIKTAVAPSSVVASVRRVIREIDPEIAIGESRPLEELADASVAGRRYQARLFMVFGAIGLFIAVVGIYAVTVFGISRRRREMNLRVALGASRSQVVGLVLRQGMTPVAIGALAGIGGALAIGSSVASLLFEVRGHDPLVIIAVVALVALAAVATCGMAARRGLRIEPAAALRQD